VSEGGSGTGRDHGEPDHGGQRRDGLRGHRLHVRPPVTSRSAAPSRMFNGCSNSPSTSTRRARRQVVALPATLAIDKSHNLYWADRGKGPATRPALRRPTSSRYRHARSRGRRSRIARPRTSFTFWTGPCSN
jgi:hypothetical protein